MHQAWIDIFLEDHHADKVIERKLKQNRKWGARDRRLFAETVYEGVRWWRKVWNLLDQEPEFDEQSLWNFWGALLWSREVELPENWKELAELPFGVMKTRLQRLSKDRPIAESIPDWMDERGSQELGDQWPNVLMSLNQKAPVDLRINRLKGTREDVVKELLSEEIKAFEIPQQDDGLTLKERKNVFKSKAFQSGKFEVQDRASQRVAPFLEIQPGQRVVDACAGAGGKTLHIASLMKNKGKIISMDIHEWKLKELKLRARRNGVDIVETKVIDSAKVIKRMEATADRVLLDVPCSGMGVLRRNPDTKWKLSNAEIDRLIGLQREILAGYSKMVKPGGKLVYATCSLLKSENEDQVDWFLKGAGDQWTLEEVLRINPDQGQGDGFFAARFLKR